jgi:hypothetical protein
MMWQPIDTAPKDGTPILVWFRGRMHVAEYGPIWHAHNKHWFVRDPATDQEETSTMVKQITRTNIDGRPISGTHEGPTHWAALPSSAPHADHHKDAT